MTDLRPRVSGGRGWGGGGGYFPFSVSRQLTVDRPLTVDKCRLRINRASCFPFHYIPS